jgi:DNA polymerase/3'-5' exonuclease PolX
MADVQYRAGMSAGERRPLEEAERAAEAFRDLFPRDTYRHWTVAGSVRRRKEWVSDIEHVVVPAMEPPRQASMFGDGEPTNKLWQWLEHVVMQGRTVMAQYVDRNGRITNRWGSLYRGVQHDGWKHEIFTADEMNLGAQLLIRTGPAQFSHSFVGHLLAGGRYRQRDGYLIGRSTGAAVPVPDERTYFQLAGLAWIEPEDRT